MSKYLYAIYYGKFSYFIFLTNFYFTYLMNKEVAESSFVSYFYKLLCDLSFCFWSSSINWSWSLGNFYVFFLFCFVLFI